MKTSIERLVFWAPRVSCILFALFISVFALDVFGHGAGFWKTTLALFMHLVPTWIILTVLAIAWHREWVGAVVYVALGVLYLLTAWGRFNWSAYVMIPGPLFLVGILFLINWCYKQRFRASA
ncbi:MAG: hypothetical protein HY043_14295 [Verrucomicrobia bacterium]|nr:hypothetical protein [Verrucomicrobiota bacterium]